MHSLFETFGLYLSPAIYFLLSLIINILIFVAASRRKALGLRVIGFGSILLTLESLLIMMQNWFFHSDHYSLQMILYTCMRVLSLTGLVIILIGWFMVAQKRPAAPPSPGNQA